MSCLGSNACLPLIPFEQMKPLNLGKKPSALSKIGLGA
jgi:hypothetical protein